MHIPTRLQHVLLVLLFSSAALPGQVLTDEKAAQWREQIRETLFVPDPLPPLDVKVHSSFDIDDSVVAERISYGTQFGMRVPAILYLPKKRTGKVPALIIVNGHGGDKYSWYSFYSGVLYAHAGAAVLTYDPAGEGERNPERLSGTRAHDQLERIPELARRQSGQMITDVMQAVTFLSQRPEVDPSRIAAAGYSMGSFVLSLTGAVEPRLKACVLAGGGNLDGPEEYWDNSKPMCQGIPYRSLSFLGDRAAAIYALHALRGPTVLMNGLEDSVVNIPKTGEPFLADLRRRTVDLLGNAKSVFEYDFVPQASHRPLFVTRMGAEWLERQLDFPAWTPDDISQLPTTHISEWAKTEGVEMDPGYTSEHREGGTRALGRFVHGPSREKLSVFSPEQWEQEKDRLVIDSWVRHAMSAMAVSP